MLLLIKGLAAVEREYHLRSTLFIEAVSPMLPQRRVGRFWGESACEVACRTRELQFRFSVVARVHSRPKEPLFAAINHFLLFL